MSFRRGFQAIVSMTTRTIRRKCAAGLMTGAGFWIAAKPFAFCEGKSSKLQAPDPSTLSSPYLIKNASIQTIDAATSLITQTVSSLLEVHASYTQSMQTLLKLMELHLEVLGSAYREEKVQDAMLHIRMEINELKDKQQNLEIIFSCAERVLLAAAEAAHAAGAEYAAMAASERLNSAKFQLQMSGKKLQDLHLDLARMEAKTVAETAQHEKRQAEKRSTQTDNEPAVSSTESEAVYEDIPSDRTDEDVQAEFKTIGLPRPDTPGSATGSYTFSDGHGDDIIITGIPKGGFPQEETVRPEERFTEELQDMNTDSNPDKFSSFKDDEAEELKA